MLRILHSLAMLSLELLERALKAFCNVPLLRQDGDPCLEDMMGAPLDTLLMVHDDSAEYIKEAVLRMRFVTTGPVAVDASIREARDVLHGIQNNEIPKKPSSEDIMVYLGEMEKYDENCYVPDRLCIAMVNSNFAKLLNEYVERWDLMNVRRKYIAHAVHFGLFDVVEACVVTEDNATHTLEAMFKNSLKYGYPLNESFAHHPKDSQKCIRYVLKKAGKGRLRYVKYLFHQCLELETENGPLEGEALAKFIKHVGRINPPKTIVEPIPLYILEAWALYSDPSNIRRYVLDYARDSYKVHHPLWMLCYPEKFPVAADVLTKPYELQPQLQYFWSTTKHLEIWMESREDVYDLVRVRIKQGRISQPDYPTLRKYYSISKRAMKRILREIGEPYD